MTQRIFTDSYIRALKPSTKPYKRSENAAKEDQIVAIPTIVRKLPPPLRRLVGDLSDSERAVVGLQLRPRS